MKVLRQIALTAVFTAMLPAAVHAQPKEPAQPPAIAQTPSELSATQVQLMALLRVSPQLALVVSSDPSLLSNTEYISHSNPELAQFVKSVVTEIVRPPERASVGGKAPPAPPQADVQGALLLITPAPEKDQLEVTVRLHVNYPVPQRSGPPDNARTV